MTAKRPRPAIGQRTRTLDEQETQFLQTAALTSLTRERDKLTKLIQTRSIRKEIEDIEKQIADIRAKLQHSPAEGSGSAITEPTGFTFSHELSVATFAVANDVIIIWRPINLKSSIKLDGSLLTGEEVIARYKGKALNVKGKSSTHPPIAADIPVDVRLSKLLVENPSSVLEYQEKNNKLLLSSSQTLASYREKFRTLTESQIDTKELLNLIHEANEELITVTEDVLTKLGNPLYYALDSS